MKLNHGQSKALEGFKDFILNDDPDARLFILEGYSGCGKSTLIRSMVNEANNLLNFVSSLSPTDSRKTIALTATTNQAADNLSQLVQSQLVTTYHSYMGFKIGENYHDGTTYITSTRNTMELYNTILVIDEASYMNQEEIDLVLYYMHETCKLVLIGDPCQLLGVGAKRPDAFYQPTQYHYYLTEVMRQGGSSLILDFGEQHREAILNQHTTLPEIVYDNKSIVLCTGEQYELTLDRLFTTNPAAQRAMSYRNKNVVQDNEFVRETLGYPDDHLTAGELITSNSVLYTEHQSKIVMNNNERGVIQNYMNDECIAYKHDSGLEVEIPCRIYYVRSLKTNQIVRCPTPIDIQDYFNTLKELAELARQNRSLWSIYFKVKKHIADIRPAYASTVHKAQGLTMDYACLDLEDIDYAAKSDIDMALRLRYVGVTRAAKTAYLYIEE